MANVNIVVLGGNLTRDPSMRFTPGGAAVADFGLAINREWTDKDGTKKKEVCFVDVTVWGKQAEACTEFLKKGSSALIEGRLTLDQWADKNTNEKRSKLKVVAERVQFIGGKKADQPNPGMEPVEQPKDEGAAPAKGDDGAPF
jgi:single-strand DNA-binding protein